MTKGQRETRHPPALTVNTNFSNVDQLHYREVGSLQAQLAQLEFSSNVQSAETGGHIDRSMPLGPEVLQQLSRLSVSATGSQDRPSIPPHGPNRCHTTFDGNPYSPIPITPGAPEHYAFFKCQTDNPPQCISDACPLGGRHLPHNEGLYLHNNELAGPSRHGVWGWSNPPPEIRAAFAREVERKKMGREFLFDMPFADILQTQSFDDHMAVHEFVLHHACHVVMPHQLETYMMGGPKLDREKYP
ncbi:MAG: hypothetical protein LQ342_002171 [Letrouitia transgressa]|nr:MAG: hypothetical protein LQ342_002171 [Letrouitia transgressa]